MTTCSTAILAEKAYCRSCTYSIKIFTSAFARNFSSKWWLAFKVETWNFTKNKLLKLVNAIKADILFADLNLNIIIQKKKCQKKAHFMDALKTRGFVHLNNETCCCLPPIKISGYAPALWCLTPTFPGSTPQKLSACDQGRIQGEEIGAIAPPKIFESNFFHHDFEHFRKQHSLYRAIFLSIVLSQQCCDVYFISLTVVSP